MSVITIANQKTWDKFIDDSPYGTIFHKWDFLRIIEKHTGTTLLPLGVYKGSELICAFPLFSQRYRGMRLLFSPPRHTTVPYLGFVMSSRYAGLKQRRRESYINEVADEVHKEIKKLSPNYILINTVPMFDDIRAFKWNGYQVDINYDYYFDLQQSLDEIWDGFDNKCKKKIKDCKGLPLQIKQVDDADTFYHIMSTRLSKKGQTHHALTPAYLRDILDKFKDNIKMYFLYDGSEIGGIQVVCEYNQTSTLWMGSPNGYYNEYLIWELIQDSKARGFKRFDLPGADTKRLTPFKSQFNPSLAVDFSISKKDTIGKVAEWAFVNVVKAWV